MRAPALSLLLLAATGCVAIPVPDPTYPDPTFPEPPWPLWPPAQGPPCRVTMHTDCNYILWNVTVEADGRFQVGIPFPRVYGGCGSEEGWIRQATATGAQANASWTRHGRALFLSATSPWSASFQGEGLSACPYPGRGAWTTQEGEKAWAFLGEGGTMLVLGVDAARGGCWTQDTLRLTATSPGWIDFQAPREGPCV